VTVNCRFHHGSLTIAQQIVRSFPRIDCNIEVNLEHHSDTSAQARGYDLLCLFYDRVWYSPFAMPGTGAQGIIPNIMRS